MHTKIKFLLIGIGILLILIQGVMAITDNNPSNNVMNITINVIQTENISIYYVPVDDITKTEFDKAIINLTDFFNRTYPVADGGLIIGKSESNINVEKPEILNKNDRSSILKEVQKRASKAGFAYGIGIVRENWFLDRTNIPTSTGVTNDRWALSVLVESGQIKTVAHEVGHKKPFNFCEEYNASAWTRQDNDGTLCPNAVNATNGRSLNSTCLDNSGCPTSTFSLLYNFGNINDITELRNFMGQTDDPDNIESSDNLFFESWVSEDSYKVLLNKLNKTEEKKVDSCLIISATFDIFGVITLDPFYVISKTLCKFFESEEGEFSVRTLDNQSALIENISFSLEFAEYADGGNITALNSTFAIFAIPFNGSVSTINFLQNDTIKSQRNTTPNTPNITLTSSLGNQIFDNSFTINWNATDLDNNTIQYAILISSDNGDTYSTLEIDYPNTSLTINSTNFINSNKYKIKILATDGINTGNDTSDTFSIYHDSQNKFTIKNSSGSNIAWFGDQGNIVIKGKLEQNSNFQATDNFAFKIRNNLNDVLIIENNGSMYIKGTLSENQATIPINMDRNEFRFKWNNEFKTNINESGYIFTKGTLTEDGDS